MRKEYRRNKAKENFINYIHKTWKNKLCAVAMFMTGVLGVVVVKEAVAVFLVLFALPLFFTKKQRFQ